jgi:hypothetical protein
MTTFYGRDREEEDTGHKVFHTWEEFCKYFNSVGAEYAYIMRDGVWYTASYQAVMDLSSLTRLDDELQNLVIPA